MSKRDSISHLHSPVNEACYQETLGSPKPSSGKRALAPLIREME